MEEKPSLKVVGESGDGESALAMIAQLLPDVAVLDIDMPKMDGLGVARELARRGIETNIVFLTLHTHEDLFRAAIELRCRGYLLKDSATQEIIACIRAVVAGQIYISPAMTAKLVRSKSASPVVLKEAPASNLTPTERKILQLIAEGKSSKEIGEDLSNHYRTVENHRTNICRKLEIEGANALLGLLCRTKRDSDVFHLDPAKLYNSFGHVTASAFFFVGLPLSSDRLQFCNSHLPVV
jgi:DNA-binding NarL/FixJ family response regulator